MKLETQINKCKAKYLREIWLITGCKTLNELYEYSGINKRKIGAILAKYEPEMYIELVPETKFFLLDEIPKAELELLDLSKENKKFLYMVDLIKQGYYNKTQLALLLNVHRRQLYRMLHKLVDKLNVQKVN